MTAPLIDPFQRAISYLRVSVTDRCDFRCVYCMSENMTFLPKRELLTLEELDRLCSTFIRMGVEKLRITGGEPLVRKGIMTFFDAMTRHLEDGTLKELTLTTNGSQMERFAADLYAAGVRRVNISLDTLDDQKFADITRWGRLAQVIKGIDAAQNAGLRVKINTVALKGFNEDELFTLTEWCASRDMDLTFIEVMPMGDIGNEDRLGQYWKLSASSRRSPITSAKAATASVLPAPASSTCASAKRIWQTCAPPCATTPAMTLCSKTPFAPPSRANPKATISTTRARPSMAASRAT